MKTAHTDASHNDARANHAVASARSTALPVALGFLPLLFAIAGPGWRALVAAIAAALVAGALCPGQPWRAGLLTVAPAVVVAAVRVSTQASSEIALLVFVLLAFPGVIAAAGLVAAHVGAAMARALTSTPREQAVAIEDVGSGGELPSTRPSEESERGDDGDGDGDVTPSRWDRALEWVTALLSVPWP